MDALDKESKEKIENSENKPRRNSFSKEKKKYFSNKF